VAMICSFERIHMKRRCYFLTTRFKYDFESAITFTIYCPLDRDDKSNSNLELCAIPFSTTTPKTLYISYCMCDAEGTVTSTVEFV
jgi:hypothetical protein